MTRTDRARRPRSSVVPWVVAAVALMAAAFAAFGPGLGAAPVDRGAASTSPASPSSGPSSQDDTPASMARRQSGDPTALGRVDAPVVMVAYSDFQCPYCGEFARKTEPALVRKYVDSGVLRIEWRDFPYLGRESQLAARAGRAAAAQDKFWPFHDALYAHQFPPNSGHLTVAFLRDVAARLGLDVHRFTTDLQGGLAAKLVRHDLNEGLSAGVTGTPAFLVNGRPVIGALPLAEFERTIDLAQRAAAETRKAG